MDSTIEAAQLEPAIQPPAEQFADDSQPANADPRLVAIPDSHGHAKGEHKPFAEERPIPYTARMLFLWFYHACRRGSPRFMMVADHMNYLTFEDPAAVNLVRRALKLAQAGDLYGAAETAGVEVGHAQAVSEGLRRGMRYSIGAEVDNDPRSRPDAQNIVDAMRPDGMIRSVHFLPITHPTHGENWMWAFDNPEFKDLYEAVGTEAVWEIYMATLLEAVEKLPGHIVGHFYVPAVFGHWPDDAVLEGYEDKLVAACAERGMAIEINSRYLYKHYLGDEMQLEKYRTAHLRLIRKAVEAGVAIAVGSDAHSPKDQGRGFEAVLALLDEAEINEIAFPIGGRLARVALRATEELMKQHLPPEPEPLPPAPELVAAPEAEPEPVKAAAKPRKPRPSRAKVPAVAAASNGAAASDGAPATAEPSPDGQPLEAAEPAEDDADVAVASDDGAAAASQDGVTAASHDGLAAASHDGVPPQAGEVPASPPEPGKAHAQPSASEAPRATETPKPAKKAAKAAAPAAASLDPILDAVVKTAKSIVHAIVPPGKSAAAKSDAEKPARDKPAAKQAETSAPASKLKPVPAKAKPAPPAKKAAPPKKTAASKKAAPKKPIAKKSAAVTPAAKKAAAKKKPSAKKAVAKKAPVKKAGAKKAPVKKTFAKKTTPKKAAKKNVAKSAKRPAQKNASVKKTAKRARR